MIFKRKIYDRLLDWKNTVNGEKALMVKGARRIGESIVIHPKNLKEENGVLYIPAYMTFCI